MRTRRRTRHAPKGVAWVGVVQVEDRVFFSHASPSPGDVGRLWCWDSGHAAFEPDGALRPEAQLLNAERFRPGSKFVFGFPGKGWFVGQTLDFESRTLRDWPSDTEIEALCKVKRSILDDLLPPDFIVSQFGARLVDFCERAVCVGRMDADSIMPTLQRLEKVLALAARAGTEGERRVALAHVRRLVQGVVAALKQG